MAKNLRIYLDTSVIGGCFDREFQFWSRRLVKDIELGLFQPTISDLVKTELNGAPREVQRVYNRLSECSLEVLESVPEAFELRDRYLEKGILTQRYQNDAFHIAIASVGHVDILVSWNFKHIVHYDKICLFNRVNRGMGYPEIDIRCPREVVSYGSGNDENG